MAPVERAALGCPHCGAAFRLRRTTLAAAGLAPGYTLPGGLGDAWTDGVAFRYFWDGSKQVPSHWPGPAVSRCRGCRRYVWIGPAVVLRESSVTPWHWATPSGSEQPEHAPEPDEPLPAGSLYEAIAGGLARDRSEETVLRVLAWQADSDPLRREPHWPRLPSPTTLVWWSLFLLPLVAVLLLGLILRYAIQGVALGQRRKERLRNLADTNSDVVRNLRALEALLDSNVGTERLLLAEAARQQGNFERALTLLHWGFPVELRRAADFVRQQAQRKDPMLRRLEA